MSAFSWRPAFLVVIASLPLFAQASPEVPTDAPPPRSEPASPSSVPVSNVPPTVPDSASPAAPSTAAENPHPATSPGDSAASAPVPVPAPVAQVPSVPATVPGALPQAQPLPDSLMGRTRQLKSDPLASARYRSPRKAFFYSLLLPGAGQAYTGHWARGAAYLAMDVSLGIGWYYYGVYKSDEKLRQSRRWADAHWKESKYETAYKEFYESAGSSDSTVEDVLETMNPSRATYCASIYGSNSSNVYYVACAEGLPDVTSNVNYNLHYQSSQADASQSASTIASNRSSFANTEQFYSLIGQENEFVQGWDDATAATNYDNAYTNYYTPLMDGNVDTKAVDNPFGTSAAQGVYLSMRQKSNDYAKMKTWFLGGMILNHLVSAIDAALLAQSSNRSLYDMESRWWDGLQLWGGLAWNGAPATQAMAWVNF